MAVNVKLFILPFSLLILVGNLISPSISKHTTNKYLECAPTIYSCGHHQYNISYPFRLPDSPSYCGHPGFQLACSNDNSTLLVNLGAKNYIVNSIDYSSKILHCADIDLSAQSCPQTFTNTTFNLSLYDYTQYDANVTVFLNCSLYVPNHNNISCLNSSAGLENSYYSLPNSNSPLPLDLWEKCRKVAMIPIYQTVVDLLGSDDIDFAGALRGGFGLTWSVGRDWCSGCTDSGGICGYNSSSPESAMCFCRDNTNGSSRCGTTVGGQLKQNGSKGKNKKKAILGIVIGLTGFILVFLILLYFFGKNTKLCSLIIFWKKNFKNDQNIEAFLKRHGTLAPNRYMYSDIKKITKNFHDKLGQGGYGTVFKGTLSDGRMVAVKVLGDSKGNGEEFINEVASISKTSHVNIVTLLGFCLEGSKRALIYEFMHNGSLEKFIYSEKPKETLQWEKLYQIALGIARGLEYLHRGCNTHIVHFDIKPHNILLDQDFSPKIADFGLAMLRFGKDSVLSVAGMRGTVGYIAPEVFSRTFGVVSSKSDVYSYGMMVLEMVGVRRNVTHTGSTTEVYFPHWIYEHLDKSGGLQDFDVTDETEDIARKMILVGLWCIQTIPQNRPSISRVIEMLEGNVSELQVPPKPILSSPLRSNIVLTSTSSRRSNIEIVPNSEEDDSFVVSQSRL